MGILSKKRILERLGCDIANPKSLVITPLDKEAFDSDAVDLRLGNHFLFPPLPSTSAVDVRDIDPTHRDLRVHIPSDGQLVLPAHQTVLGVTQEFIKLPYDVSGQILTKSSVARTFMVIETAPWIHPNYRGCLTLEIANVSSTALILHPRMPIGQLILISIEEAVESVELSGSYIGPVRPESPARKSNHVCKF